MKKNNKKRDNPQDSSKDAKKELSVLRTKIDAFDVQFMNILKKRFDIAHKIGLVKQKHNLSVRDVQREKSVIEERIKKAKMYDLSPKFIKTIWKALFKEAYTCQESMAAVIINKRKIKK